MVASSPSGLGSLSEADRVLYPASLTPVNNADVLLAI
jgi:hypothetical protein